MNSFVLIALVAVIAANGFVIPPPVGVPAYGGGSAANALAAAGGGGFGGPALGALNGYGGGLGYGGANALAGAGSGGLGYGGPLGGGLGYGLGGAGAAAGAAAGGLGGYGGPLGGLGYGGAGAAAGAAGGGLGGYGNPLGYGGAVGGAHAFGGSYGNPGVFYGNSYGAGGVAAGYGGYNDALLDWPFFSAPFFPFAPFMGLGNLFGSLGMGGFNPMGFLGKLSSDIGRMVKSMARGIPPGCTNEDMNFMQRISDPRTIGVQNFGGVDNCAYFRLSCQNTPFMYARCGSGGFQTFHWGGPHVNSIWSTMVNSPDSSGSFAPQFQTHIFKSLK